MNPRSLDGLGTTTLFAIGMAWPACSVAGPPALVSTPGRGAAPAAGAAAAAVTSAFLPAERCAVCHSQSPNARALTTQVGDDASPHGLWKATAMANSFRDRPSTTDEATSLVARYDKAYVVPEAIALTVESVD